LLYVNEIILDKSGKVAVVVFGVGGFLGTGEHDVAVSMDKLKFVEEPVRTSATTTTTTTTKDTTTTRDTTTGRGNGPGEYDDDSPTPPTGRRTMP